MLYPFNYENLPAQKSLYYFICICHICQIYLDEDFALQPYNTLEPSAYSRFADKVRLVDRHVKYDVIANELEIDLYSGRVREDRKRSRYDIKAPGKVTGIQIAGKRITLRKPIEITTKNISANGLLIESEAGSFEKGDRILIRLDLGETTLRGMYEVVRIQNQNLWTEEYGCRHIAMGKSRENYDRRKKEHYIKKDSDPVPVGWHGTFRRSV